MIIYIYDINFLFKELVFCARSQARPQDPGRSQYRNNGPRRLHRKKKESYDYNYDYDTASQGTGTEYNAGEDLEPANIKSGYSEGSSLRSIAQGSALQAGSAVLHQLVK